MVLTNRGLDKVAELNTAFFGSGEIMGKVFYDMPFGMDLTRQARALKGIDIDELDAEDLKEPEVEIVKGINNLKSHLHNLVDRNDYEPLASLFASRSISTHRFDLGQDLQEASAMALEGEEEKMYFDAYPSPIYRLIKAVHPGYILATRDEARFTDEDIKEAITRIPPSQFIRMLENYEEQVNWNIYQIKEQAARHEEFLMDFPDDLFEGILTAEETEQLQTELRGQIDALNYRIIDRVKNPNDVNNGGHYSAYNRQGKKHSVAINAAPRYYGDTLPRLVIHEGNHGLLARQKLFDSPDAQFTEDRIFGLRFNTGGHTHRNTWLDEAMTMFLEQYLLDRRNGGTQRFSLDYLDSKFDQLDAYTTISDMVLDLAYHECFDLTDALRLYLGFPPLQNDKGIDSLATFTANMRKNVLDRYGIDLRVIDQFDLNGADDAPNLMALAMLAKTRIDEGFQPEATRDYSIGDLLLRSEADIDRFAAFFVPDEIKEYMRLRGDTLVFDDPRGVRMHEAMLYHEEMLARARIYQETTDREYDEDRLMWLYFHIRNNSPDLEEANESTAAEQILAGFAEQGFIPNEIAKPHIHKQITRFLEQYPNHKIRFFELEMQEYLLLRNENRVIAAIRSFLSDEPMPEDSYITIKEEKEEASQ